ncbi:hypothetical protein SY2F82_78110 [Streptomyces sp. Y2F8-2]|nr:hypothetical protein SY2F82_78110 [Streptomyces sp. Y2F8-2]
MPPVQMGEASFDRGASGGRRAVGLPFGGWELAGRAGVGQQDQLPLFGT